MPLLVPSKFQAPILSFLSHNHCTLPSTSNHRMPPLMRMPPSKSFDAAHKRSAYESVKQGLKDFVSQISHYFRCYHWFGCLLLCNLSHGFECGLVRQIIEMCLTCIEHDIEIEHGGWGGGGVVGCRQLGQNVGGKRGFGFGWKRGV